MNYGLQKLSVGVFVLLLRLRLYFYLFFSFGILTLVLVFMDSSFDKYRNLWYRYDHAQVFLIVLQFAMLRGYCIFAYVLLSISSSESFESYMPKIFDIVVLDYINL